MPPSVLKVVGHLWTSQCESPMSWLNQGILTFDSSYQSLHPHVHLSVRNPLFSYSKSGDLFILNVRTAPGFEHHVHNTLDGMSERW